MKLKLLGASLATLAAAFSVFSQEAQPFSINASPLPEPTGFVNDYAGVIDEVSKQQLESKLKQLRETTNPSVELAVAVVRTTGGRDIFEYSLAVARGWKIGTKEDDNPSALLLIAIDDRKYFTQVSRDLEDELPDGIVGNLQRQYLVPEFRKGNYGKGIADTIDAYIGRIRGQGNVAGNANAGQPPKGSRRGGVTGGIFGGFCCIAIIVVILIIIFSRSKGGPTKRDRDRWGGGGFGGARSSGAGDALPWIIGGILAGSGGSGSSSSSSSDWGGSSGGDWGGFGGGGDFGGGGAGGDW